VGEFGRRGRRVAAGSGGGRGAACEPPSDLHSRIFLVWERPERCGTVRTVPGFFGSVQIRCHTYRTPPAVCCVYAVEYAIRGLNVRYRNYDTWLRARLRFLRYSTAG